MGRLLGILWWRHPEPRRNLCPVGWGGSTQCVLRHAGYVAVLQYASVPGCDHVAIQVVGRLLG